MDFFSREGLSCKAKSMVSTIYGIMLWATRFPSSMQTTKESAVTHEYLQFGLKAVTYFGKGKEPKLGNGGHRILHSYKMKLPSSVPLLSSSSSSSMFKSSLYSDSSTSSWSSSLTGDLLGTESGVHISSDEDIIAKEWERPERDNGDRIKPNEKYEVKKKEYPPPIPSLALTGNLRGRMPWVLTRHYVDGRLIMKMKKVKHHQYLEAHRSDSRLLLKLVPLDHTIPCHDKKFQQKNEQEEVKDLDFIEEENETDLKEHIEIDDNTTTDDDDNVGYDIEMDCSDDGDKAFDDDGDEEDVYELLEKMIDGASDRKTLTSFACSVPKSSLENGKERNEDHIRMCFSYGGTTSAEFERFLHANANEQNVFGPSPITFGGVRPVTGVV